MIYRLFYSGFFAIAVILIVFYTDGGMARSQDGCGIEKAGNGICITGSAKPTQGKTATIGKSTRRASVCYFIADSPANTAETAPYYGKMIISCVSFSDLTSPLDYSSEPFIELCINDSSNKRTGYDNSSQNVIKEIPDCFYHEDRLSSVDPKYPPGPAGKTIVVENPTEGVYSLRVMGINSGGYEVNISILDQNLDCRNILETIRRVTSPGTIHNYRISFNRADVNKFTIIKVVSPQEIKSSLQTAFSLAWIDDKKTLNDLVTKIENTDSAVKRGKRDSAINILQTFINEVEARKDRHIAGTAADIMIDDAKSLINQLQE